VEDGGIEEAGRFRRAAGVEEGWWRIAVALEKLAGIKGNNSDKELLSWPESKGEETEVQGSKQREKQKEKSLELDSFNVLMNIIFFLCSLTRSICE